MAAIAHSPHLLRVRCWLLGKLEKFHCVSKYATLRRKVARFSLCVWINIRKLSTTHSGGSARREPFSHFLPSRPSKSEKFHFASIKFPFTMNCWKWFARIMLLMVTMLSSCAMMTTVKRDIRDIQWNISQSSIFLSRRFFLQLNIVALVSHPRGNHWIVSIDEPLVHTLFYDIQSHCSYHLVFFIVCQVNTPLTPTQMWRR